MTDEELKKLAWDMVTGNVFTDQHLREGDYKLIPSIFMPLMFMTPEQVKISLEDAGMLYEYMSQAGSRSLNGYPLFYSFRVVLKSDMERLDKFFNEASKFKREFVGEVRTEE